jgi:hypothetical protein
MELYTALSALIDLPFALHRSGGEISQHARDVAAGEHCHHTGQKAGGRDIDGPDAGTCVGTPKDAGVEHVWESNIIDEGAVAGHKFGVFEAFQG